MHCSARLLIAAMLVLLVGVIAWPDQAFTAEFSADLVRSSGGDEDISKVYIKGKLRREEIMDDGELSAVNISRPDKSVTWNLMPEDEMYMEIPLDAKTADAMGEMESLKSRAKVKVLGKETVSGYECEKRSYEGSDKRQGSVIVWYSSKLDYPVKIHTTPFRGEEGMTLEYKNIKPGKIPDSKFEIPSGYEKFAIPGMPGGMPGGMPKIPGMND
jgi:hypothetical protein